MCAAAAAAAVSHIHYYRYYLVLRPGEARRRRAAPCLWPLPCAAAAMRRGRRNSIAAGDGGCGFCGAVS